MLSPDSTLAYLDAGSVSMVASAVAAGAAGVAVALKTGWRRILGLFIPRFREPVAADVDSSLDMADLEIDDAELDLDDQTSAR